MGEKCLMAFLAPHDHTVCTFVKRASWNIGALQHVNMVGLFPQFSGITAAFIHLKGHCCYPTFSKGIAAYKNYHILLGNSSVCGVCFLSDTMQSLVSAFFSPSLAVFFTNSYS